MAPSAGFLERPAEPVRRHRAGDVDGDAQGVRLPAANRRGAAGTGRWPAAADAAKGVGHLVLALLRADGPHLWCGPARPPLRSRGGLHVLGGGLGHRLGRVGPSGPDAAHSDCGWKLEQRHRRHGGAARDGRSGAPQAERAAGAAAERLKPPQPGDSGGTGCDAAAAERDVRGGPRARLRDERVAHGGDAALEQQDDQRGRRRRPSACRGGAARRVVGSGAADGAAPFAGGACQVHAERRRGADGGGCAGAGRRGRRHALCGQPALRER
mmetsp:Transcript_23253/g.77188  ORF Transcript_23253/g.77188 Transcript_23253/m.77188 type:complete len:269 (+) Transcript_23253:245-1051(+)